MLKKISIILGSIVLLAGIASVGVFVVRNSSLTFAEASVCTPNANDDVIGWIEPDNHTATIMNKSANCTYKVGFASYKKFDENIDNQQIVDSKVQDLAPKGTVKLSVNVPTCAAQIDVFRGDVITSFAGGVRYATGNRLIEGRQLNGTNYCVKDTPAPTPAVCPKTVQEAKQMMYDGKFYIKIDLDSATNKGNATVYNNTNCNIPLSMVSYRMYDQKLSTQKFFDGSPVVTIAPKSTGKLSVNLPSCMAQVDVYYGNEAGPHVLYDDNRDGYRTFAWAFYQNTGSGFGNAAGNFCHDAPTTGTLKIVKTVINDNGGTKQVSDFALFIENTQVTSGQVLTLPANTYSVHENNLPGYQAGAWGGDCSADGKVKVEAGKNKTCTITNNDIPPVVEQKGCIAIRKETYDTVGNPLTPVAQFTFNLDNGQTVQNDSNGNAYFYNVSTGTHTVTENVPSGWTNILVTPSNNQVTVSAGNNCAGIVFKNKQNPIYVPPTTPNLTADCSATPTSAYVNESITWKAYAYGGNNAYSYSWTGTDGLYGSTQTVVQSYATTGQKSATVNVYSNGQTITRTCTVNIIARPANVSLTSTTDVPPTQVGGVYLSQVPYTGIGSNIKVSLFILGLLAWSSAIAYFIIRRKADKLGLTVSQFIAEGGATHTMAFAGPTVAPISAPVMPEIAIEETPVAPEITTAEAVSPTDFMGAIESRARAERMIISADALNIISAVTGRDTTDAYAMIDKLASVHRSNLMDQNDWVVLNAQKVSSIL